MAGKKQRARVPSKKDFLDFIDDARKGPDEHPKDKRQGSNVAKSKYGLEKEFNDALKKRDAQTLLNFFHKEDKGKKKYGGITLDECEEIINIVHGRVDFHQQLHEKY